MGYLVQNTGQKLAFIGSASDVVFAASRIGQLCSAAAKLRTHGVLKEGGGPAAAAATAWIQSHS